jgi:hypothetical protein
MLSVDLLQNFKPGLVYYNPINRLCVIRKRYLHSVEDYVRFQSFYLGDDFYEFPTLGNNSYPYLSNDG